MVPPVSGFQGPVRMKHPNPSGHLWLALSPHGYGHAAMTAPVIEALRRRRPEVRLTIQTALPRAFLEERYGTDFEYVPEIPDFGMRMHSASAVDLEASRAAYAALHADFEGVVAGEAARLRAARPDLVLANVPYVTLAAAARAGIRAVALSSLNWADIYRHYLGGHPEADAVWRQMRDAYDSAEMFLRVTPAMDMPSLGKVRDVGTVARRGVDRRAELAARRGGGRLGLVAFGGIGHDLSMAGWPRLDGWTWISALDHPPGRPDIVPWRDLGLSFADLAASVDLVVTKPGYGTFSEAALSGVAVLYALRPDWPETPALDRWLAAHTRALGVPADSLPGGLEDQLRKLFSLPVPQVAEPTGNDEAAAILDGMLPAETGTCACS